MARNRCARAKCRPVNSENTCAMVLRICAVARTTDGCASTRRSPSAGVSTSSSISAATVSTQPCVPRVKEKP